MLVKYFFVIFVFILSACQAGGVDTRFNDAASQTVEIDGYPVSVSVIKVSDKTYDVQSGEGRAIAFTGVSDTFAMYDRFRRGAMIRLRSMVGKDAKISTLSEYMPTGFAKIFIRYEVTAP